VCVCVYTYQAQSLTQLRQIEDGVDAHETDIIHGAISSFKIKTVVPCTQLA
jgi:hypothetical protein